MVGSNPGIAAGVRSAVEQETIMRIKLAIVVALLALGVAGCSDTGGEGVTSAGGTTSTQPTSGANSSTGGSEMDQLLAYAQCMRDNGVPNFPDPEVGEDGQMQGLDINGDEMDPAAVQAAQDKCRRYLPNGGAPQTMDPERMEQARRYAQCMRDNGVSSFPDPSPEGLKLNGNDPALNPNNPTFKAAQEKCSDILGQAPGGGPGLSSGGPA